MQAFSPPTVSKSSKPLKFGILGAANIAPPALISPARSHPDVVVYAVAARNQGKAEAFARKYAIEKVYSGPEGYQRRLTGHAAYACLRAVDLIAFPRIAR